MKNTPRRHYLKRHSQYIENRLSVIKQLLDSLHSPERDNTLIDIMSFFMSHNTLPVSAETLTPAAQSISEIKELIKRWDIVSNGDILGYIYQKLKCSAGKKKIGQFFTPGDIVSHLTESAIRITENPSSVILDPACGSGQFLMSAYIFLHEQLSTSQRENPETIISKYIYGIDTDPVAVQICKFNLSRISGVEESKINIVCSNFLGDDNLIEGIKPDIIIGNPPWGGMLTKEEKKRFRNKFISSQSGINTFTLFLEQAFRITNGNGIVAFLIPEAYLNIKAHRESRKFVLKHASIKEIALWGERFKGVFAPAASIIAKKESNQSIISRNIVCIKDTKDTFHQTASRLVPQDSFKKTPDNIFNINYSRKCVNIIETISDNAGLTLKNRSVFFLGIVSGDNTRHISPTKTQKHMDPILIGKDLSKYHINFSGHYFHYNPEDLQQVAPQHLYQQKNKVLYRFIGKKLTFAIDRSGYYTLNNINGFIPSIEELNTETIVSLLNSDLIQYYYENNFFTVKVLKGNLERLPLKRISRENQEKIKTYYSDLENGCGNADYLKANIDDIIFHEYGIKDREAYLTAAV